MKICELTVLSDDLNGTKKFYSDTLGFPLLLNNAQQLTFQAGASRLHFRKSDKEKPVYHFAFNIHSNQISQAMEWIQGKAELIVSDSGPMVDFKNWQAQSVYFWDNNGNILEFIARAGLNLESDYPFDTTQVLSISEMGFPVKNVPNYLKKVQSDFNLNIFERQIPSDDFAALGDDNGLLILVREGRPWFLTTKEAKKHWSKIQFEQNDILFEWVLND
ncbi:MAG: hypothetical protein JXR71_09030 [Bacteroidales bacterium]|nr:hypothetical protein [Bacteroidales bacterium]